MRVLSRRTAVFLAAGALMAGAGRASAITLPLFSFAQKDSSVKAFRYDNATGDFFVKAAVNLMTFNGLGGGLPSGEYTLTLHGTTTLAPNIWAVDTFVFKDGATTVLDIDTTGDLLFFQLSGSTGGFGASDAGGAIGITYSSDATSQNLNGNPPGYPGNVARDWSISLSGVTTGFALGTNGRYETFDAVISGNGNYSVPEPGSMAMLVGVGVMGSVVAFRRRRR